MIGIENVNEFYTTHYLAAILANDIRGRLDAWRQVAEGGSATPMRAPRALQAEFFRYRERLAHVRDVRQRGDV